MKYYQLVVDSYHDTKFAPAALYRKIQIEIQRNMDYEVLKDISLFLENIQMTRMQPKLNSFTQK